MAAAAGQAAAPLCLGRWTVGDRQVSLLIDNEDRFKYLSPPELPETEVDPQLYSDIRKTCQIVRFFRDVISENLRTGIISSAFLPVFSGQPYLRRGDELTRGGPFRVALFGKRDPDTRTIRDARWGIFDGTNETVRTIEIENPEGIIQECLVNVLCRDQSVELYERSARAIATCDADGRIQSIAFEMLRRASVFNERVAVDELHWAVTLVSAQDGPQSGWLLRREGVHIEEITRPGHAMIACEGIRDGFPFLKYAHITQRAAGRQIAASGAIVRTINGFIGGTLNGPTWARPRVSVERMLRPIEEAVQHGRQLPFMPGRQMPAVVNPYLKKAAIFSGVVVLLAGPEGAAPWVFFTAVFGGLGSCVLSRLARRYDCVHWTREQMPVAGIRIQLPQLLFTPNGIVQYLREHPEAVAFED